MRKASLHCLTATAALLWALSANAQLGALPEPPADAQPGECYGLVYVPPHFDVHEEQVQVAAAGERSERVAAQYETVDEVVTLPASQRRKIITPAVIETEQKTITVPARKRTVQVPASYRTVKETVVTATGTVLKPSKPLPGQDEGAICLVETPTATQVVARQVLNSPASSRTITEPARERTVSQRKVITPAVTELVPVPARTITRRVKKLIAPETTRSVPVPARFQTVSRRTLQSPSRAEWQRVLCETNFTPALVQSLQEALTQQGVYKGPAHGQMNPQTASAVRLYQERNELPTGGLGLATLDRLGVSVSDGQTLTLRP